MIYSTKWNKNATRVQTMDYGHLSSSLVIHATRWKSNVKAVRLKLYFKLYASRTALYGINIIFKYILTP